VERLRTSELGIPVAICVAGAIFLLVGSLHSTNFATLTVHGVANGAVYASLALALVLIYQATHVINFAQGELAMLTTFIAYQLIQWGLSYWAAFFATLAISFILGVVLQITVIRPVQHRSVVATVIVTIGLFLVIDGIVSWVWSAQLLVMPSPFGSLADQFNVGGVYIEHLWVWTSVVVLVSLAAVWALFRFTKLGLAMRAAALRPAAAALAGVRVDTMLAIGWGLAAVLGAVAGLMAEPSNLFLDPGFMGPILVYAFAAAALGGLESPVGAVVGGIAIGVFQSMVIGYLPGLSTNLQIPFSFAVILVILLVKPNGLFGRREVQRV
jgi:branched-chain amino acid transport system permease protein